MDGGESIFGSFMNQDADELLFLRGRVSKGRINRKPGYLAGAATCSRITFMALGG